MAGEDQGQRSGLKPMQAARRAADQLTELVGKPLDGIAGFERIGDDGWRVLVELVEISRVPRSTDVLGTYEVNLDGDGDLVGYERVQRFVRGRTGDDDR